MRELQIDLISESGAWSSFQSDAKNLISTTVYGLACKLDAVVDLKELYIRRLSVLPNDCIRIRLVIF